MAIWSTILHHLEVAREALAREKAGPKHQTRSRDELEFLPAHLEVMEAPPSPLGRAVLFTIAAVFTIGVAWATFGEVDIIATAQGKIIPSGKVKVIQPLETGTVRAILVADGDRVAKGDVLIELDTTGSEADQERLIKDLATARITEARLRALMEDDPEAAFAPPSDIPGDLVEMQRRRLLSELAEQKARREGLESDIDRLSRTLPNIGERVSSHKELVDQGHFPKLKYLEEQQELINTEQNLASAKAKLDQLIAEERRSILDREAETRQQIDGLEQELTKARERNRLQTLLAPVDGVVQQLDVHTVGGVVTPAQALLTIVPASNRIEIEANVLNKDIGFVRAGQPAEAKIESFPFTKYGTIPADVTTVFSDAVLDEKLGWVYLARFALSRDTILVGDKYVSLTPGMAVTMEIKTGKRKLIQYLLAPLQQYRSETMRER